MRRILVGMAMTLLAGVTWFSFRGPAASATTPHIPTDDTVVSSVPRKGRSGVGETRSPIDVARRAIEDARTQADPRYLGHAQAALAPWWNDPSPPAEVLLLRATIRQSLHDFEAALADLDQLVRRSPDDPQAWLTRSVVLSVRGDYAESRASCAPLAHLAGTLVATQCFASIDSLTGHAKDAHAALRDASQRTPTLDAERAWILSSLGEIAVRAGDDAAGEAHYEAALEADPSDAYTRAAYADLLLDEGRAAEAIPWLRGRETDDNLLLRLAIAETESHAPEAPAHVAALRTRHLASQARGDVVHRREQARFQLSLEHDADTALALAKANWQVQREPADARILLESALAANRPNEAAPAMDFLERHRAEEPRLIALLSRARAGAGRTP